MSQGANNRINGAGHRGPERPQMPAGSSFREAALAAQTASATSNISYPVTGIRLNVTSYSSGSVNLGVVQWP